MTSEIKKFIILLLKDRELNIKLGMQAKKFAESEFLPEKIIHQWLKLFDDVIHSRPCEYIKPTKNFGNNFKRLKIINRWLINHHVPSVPLTYAYGSIKNLMRKITPGIFKVLRKIIRK